MVRFIAGLLATLTLAGCTLPVVDPSFTGLAPDADPATFECCHDPERQPAWFGIFARDVAEPLAPLFESGDDSGLMAAFPAAGKRILAQAQPLDLLVFSSKSHLSSRMLPGWFTHSAVYVGSESQLRAAGLWNAPGMARFHDDIRAGKIVVEGVAGGVRHASWTQALGSRDAVALLRPTVSPGDRRASLARALAMVGVNFDYYYDMETCDSLACSEVVCRSLPALSFPIRETYGTKVLLPDDIAAKAIRGEDLRVVDYVRADETGWTPAGLRGAMSDIAGFWGPMETAKKGPVVASQDLEVCEFPGG